jgi:hypothetical protein
MRCGFEEGKRGKAGGKERNSERGRPITSVQMLTPSIVLQFKEKRKYYKYQKKKKAEILYFPFFLTNRET